MKTILISLLINGLLITGTSQSPVPAKLSSSTGHISFYSHTAVEDITADNFKVTSTIQTESGEVVFSVPMQAFEFEKALMQKHYNSPKFLDTKKFPKAKLKGKITNIASINLSKDGTYPATVEGELELHGVTKKVKETGTITVKGDKITIDSKMKVTLADYNIAFEKGKPSTNIAKTIDVTIRSEYATQ